MGIISSDKKIITLAIDIDAKRFADRYEPKEIESQSGEMFVIELKERKKEEI